MNDAPASPPAPSGVLQRRLGLWSATAVVIGSTIGSGIFRSPAGIADKLPGPGPLLAVWVVGGIFALCGALTLAEIATAMPRTGGVYVFCREGWGRLAGFLFGWGQLVMIRAASLGAISITFAEYFLRVTGKGGEATGQMMSVRLTAVAAIVVTALFNIVGVRTSSAVVNFTVLAKYGGLVFIVLIALAWGIPHGGAAHFTPAAPPGSFTMAAFGLALVSALWAFDGWADVSYNAGEVTNPQRNLPRALVGGTLLVLAVYLAANVGYLAVLPVEQVRVSKLVAADVAEVVMGSAGVIFVSVTVMISTFGTLNTVLLTSPRIFFAMADDKLFFPMFARVHPSRGTPFISIILVAILGIVFVLVGTFESLADAFVTAFLPFYALAVSSVFRLRRRRDYAPTFRVPLYPLVPALFVLSVLYLLANAVIQPGSRMSTLAVLGVVALGAPVYAFTLGRRRTNR
ncbi:MAG: amino acid permease [Gemmatimonadaceae bacterium]|nr:amino acid permease [Gemmatimonadaceae bacterium]